MGTMTTDMNRDARKYHCFLAFHRPKRGFAATIRGSPSFRKTCSYGSASTGFRAIVDVDIPWVIDPPDRYQTITNVGCRVTSSGRQHDDG